MTGIVCASDPLALGRCERCGGRGMSVPSDVSVVGYDDSYFMSCADPPLTTVRQPIESMGQAAVELLVKEIAGVRVTHAELLFEPELVVRGSTGPAPGMIRTRAVPADRGLIWPPSPDAPPGASRERSPALYRRRLTGVNR